MGKHPIMPSTTASTSTGVTDITDATACNGGTEATACNGGMEATACNGGTEATAWKDATAGSAATPVRIGSIGKTSIILLATAPIPSEATSATVATVCNGTTAVTNCNGGTEVTAWKDATAGSAATPVRIGSIGKNSIMPLATAPIPSEATGATVATVCNGGTEATACNGATAGTAATPVRYIRKNSIVPSATGATVAFACSIDVTAATNSTQDQMKQGLHQRIYRMFSASGTSAVAIDNKIEQAMDLVKSHLMFAVREEVEVLKERIAELMERISHLEVENTVLRTHASPETLAMLPLLPPPGTGTGPTPQHPPNGAIS